MSGDTPGARERIAELTERVRKRIFDEVDMDLSDAVPMVLQDPEVAPLIAAALVPREDTRALVERLRAMIASGEDALPIVRRHASAKDAEDIAAELETLREAAAALEGPPLVEEHLSDGSYRRDLPVRYIRHDQARRISGDADRVEAAGRYHPSAEVREWSAKMAEELRIYQTEAGSSE